MRADRLRRRRAFRLSTLFALTLVVLILAPMVGERFISPVMLWRPEFAGEADIFWRLRVPRVVLAFLAGAGLALSGLSFQAMFRNPLATPFTLGVASGASLGTALYIRFGVAVSLLGVSGLSLAAFVGALATMLLVYGITRMRGGFSSATLLLAGVAISFFFSSLILFTQFIFEAQHSFRMMRWMMGSLEVVGWRPVFNLLIFVAVGAAVLSALTHELNLMLTGEDLATSRGVDVRRVKRRVFFAASLMVGGVVAFCGPIGFVGMMAPHICRLLIGSDHRWLAPATVLFGGLFLVVCDAISRTVLTSSILPVGIITALLGGPFFLWLLLQDRGFTR